MEIAYFVNSSECMVYIAPMFSIDEEVGLRDSTVKICRHLYLGSPPRAGPNSQIA